MIRERVNPEEDLEDDFDPEDDIEEIDDIDEALLENEIEEVEEEEEEDEEEFEEDDVLDSSERDREEVEREEMEGEEEEEEEEMDDTHDSSTSEDEDAGSLLDVGLREYKRIVPLEKAAKGMTVINMSRRQPDHNEEEDVDICGEEQSKEESDKPKEKEVADETPVEKEPTAKETKVNEKEEGNNETDEIQFVENSPKVETIAISDDDDDVEEVPMKDITPKKNDITPLNDEVPTPTNEEATPSGCTPLPFVRIEPEALAAEKVKVMKERDRRKALMHYYNRLQKLLPGSHLSSDGGLRPWPRQVLLQKATDVITHLRKTDARLEMQVETQMQENFLLKKKLRDFEILRTIKRLKAENMAVEVPTTKTTTEATKEESPVEKQKEEKKESVGKVLPVEGNDEDDKSVDTEDMGMSVDESEDSTEDEDIGDPLGNTTDNSQQENIRPTTPEVISIDT